MQAKKLEFEFVNWEGGTRAIRIIDDRVDFWDGRRWTGPLSIADLIALAKGGGGKVSEVYPDTCKLARKALGLQPTIELDNKGLVNAIKALTTERDALEFKCESLRIDRDGCAGQRDALKARVAELTKGKVKPVNLHVGVRCIDCENLVLTSVQDGSGNCSYIRPMSNRDIYRCLPLGCTDFTPAAEGCGNSDQALRAELAWVSKDGGK